MSASKLNKSFNFMAIPKPLLENDVGLNSNDILLYSHMADRYLFFLEQRGKYSPGESPVSSLPMSLATFKRSRKKLEELGYIEKVLERSNNATVWHVNPIKMNGLPSQMSPIITDSITAMATAEEKRQVVEMTKDRQSIHELGEDVCPFSVAISDCEVVENTPF